MVDLAWHVKIFHEFTLDHLFDVLRLRVDVFVVEQQSAYPELDAFDRHSGTRHVFGCDENGLVITYVRILPPGLCYPEVSFGRFVVRREARGQGIGHQLIRAAFQEILKCWPDKGIRISAQNYLQRFYQLKGP